MVRSRAIIILAVWCIVFACVSAARAESRADYANIFDQAATYYEKGLYDKAIAEYESILNKGLEGGNIYYNLGNCYLKKGAIGKAIVSYERAKGFMPRDSDLLFNYRYAKSLIKQKKAAPVKIWLLSAIWRTNEFLSTRETIVVTSVIYYCTILLVTLFVFFKKYRAYLKYAIAVFAVLLLVMFIWSVGKVDDLNTAAIVVTNITDSKLEPLENAPANFPLYEGTKVYILRTRGDWCKIRLSDAEVGWLKKDAVELIGR